MKTSFSQLGHLLRSVHVLVTFATTAHAATINTQPQSQTVAPDAPVSFTVAATGTGTLTYQWRKDSVDIPGATSNTFSLPNVKPWHIGDYTVKITDASGTMTSSAAVLNLSGVNSGIWKGLIYYFPLNATGNDNGLLANHLSGTAVTSTQDRSGQPSGAYSFQRSNLSRMVSAQNLIISPNGQRSVSFWVRLAPTYSGVPSGKHVTLFHWGSGNSSTGTNFAGMFNPGWQSQSEADGPYRMWGGYADNVYRGPVFYGKWYHCVMTLSNASSSSNVEMYINGILATKITHDQKQLNTTPTKFRLGTISDDGSTIGSWGDGDSYDFGFDGAMDDVRIYNRALTSAEVYSLYASEATVQISSQPQSLSVIQNQPASLSVTATGVGSVTYEWEKDGVVIPGATTSTLAFQAVKPWNVGSYRVRITDSVGTVVSAAAQLTLNTAQPASLWQDLLLFLPLAGNTTDLSPSARTVTQSNVTSGVSPLGTVAGSASFNGTSSRMDFSPNLPDLTGMTFSTWLRPAITSGNQSIFVDWDDAASNDVSVALIDDKIFVQSTKNGASLSWTSPSLVQAGQWMHLTFVMGATRSLVVVNGQVIATLDTPANNVGYKLRSNIGYFDYGAGDFFSGELSAMRIYGRALTESEAVQLYQYDAPMPEIELEQPSGTALVDGSAVTTWQALPTGGRAAAAPYVIRNVGVTNLLNLGLTKSGTHAADFLLGSLSTTTLAPGESTTFTVTFAPGAGASGTRTATLHVASNDADENPFDIALSGTAYSTTLDADSDGMNDWGEFKLSALGFNWQTPNTAQVSALYDNAGAAGLFTTTQVQNLNVGMPLLQRNPSTGEFSLTIGVSQSSNLSTWTPLPMTVPQVLINAQGKLEFRFNGTTQAAFYRLVSQPTP